MGADGRVIFAQKRFDAARSEIREAVVDFTVTDEKLLEMRANARQAFEELRALDKQNLKPGLLAAFKLW
jgi:hypothetical protein